MFVYGQGFVNSDYTCYYVIPYNFQNRIHVKMFGACEHNGRIYYNNATSIYSISKEIINDWFSNNSTGTVESPIIGNNYNALSAFNNPYQFSKVECELPRKEVDNIDIGTHHLCVIDNKLYVQETFYNRIAVYNIIEDGVVDPSTRFVPEIYPKGINANIKLYPNLQTLDPVGQVQDVSNLSVDEYRHINSMSICPDIQNTIICSSSYLRNAIDNNKASNSPKDSTIDFINTIDWTYESYNVPQYGIHDVTHNHKDNMLYYVHNTSLYMFDPYTKEYKGAVYTYDYTGSYIARGLHFESDGTAVYTFSEIVSRINPPADIKPVNTKVIRIAKDNLGVWNLLETKDLKNIVIFSSVHSKSG